MLEKYKPYIKKNIVCFILGPFFMILEASGEFIVPFLNANLINKGAETGDVGYIYRSAGWMALLALIMLVTGILGANFAIKGAARTCGGVRKDLFHKIQTFSFSDIDTFSTGSLITRITNDITQIQNFMQSLLRGFFRAPVMLIGALVMSFILDKDMARIILVVIPVLALLIFLIIKTASPRYTVMQEKLDDLNSGIEESIINERVVKSFVREDTEIRKFNGLNERLYEKSVSALKMMILLQPVSTLAINITTLLVVYTSGLSIMVGNMEIGTLTAFITYLSQILNALNFLANIFLQGTRAYASDRRISEVFEHCPSIQDGGKAENVIHRGKVSFDHVSFRYFKDNAEKVLEDISFTIEAGETIGIIGSTGSGKTTLVSLLARLYEPDEGKIFLDDTDIRDIPMAELRQKVSLVLQKNQLFAGTIRENLLWGSEDATDEECKKACLSAGAWEFIERFPGGLDTEIGQGGMNLSGGQKQRLCIARALLRDPKILIMDDSTSAVDTKTDARIRKALDEDFGNITRIIIAQRVGSILDADRIMVLNEGRIVGFDPADELLKTCEPFAEIYHTQREEQEAGA